VSEASTRVRVQSLGLDQATKAPVVILQEVGGTRALPIWIGPAEASAIAMQLAGMSFPRPLTHDLFASVIRGLGGVLRRVTITRVEDNTYFAELLIQRGDHVFTVDARPSDSIAIALRLDAELYISASLLMGSVDTTESEHDTPSHEQSGEGPSLTPEQLQERLRKLKPEDLGRFEP
jgi:bifunctional DNase/RNase